MIEIIEPFKIFEVAIICILCAAILLILVAGLWYLEGGSPPSHE